MGIGKYTFKDGYSDVGLWENDSIVIGIATYDNQDSFCGKFTDDEPDGFGIYQYTEENDTYHGYFKKDELNGFGIYYWSNGTYDLGEFVDGKLNGFGILYNKDDTIYEQGKYKNDEL